MPRSGRFVCQDYQCRGPTSYVIRTYHSLAYYGLTEGGTISHILILPLSFFSFLFLFLSLLYLLLFVSWHYLSR